jgi:hypothetical protein
MIYTVASLTYDERDGILYYTTDNGAYRDIVSLNPTTGQTKVLQKDARIGELAFNKADRSMWGIRHLNGLCTVVRMEAPYTEWTRLVTLPYGTIMYDLDISSDGTKAVGAFGEIDGKMDVRVFATQTLLKGEVTPEKRFDFGQSVPSGFVFSPDGRFLYGTSYLTGVSNVCRYEIATGETEAVSNTETGFFRPIPLSGEDLIVFRFTGRGLVPTRITGTPIKDAAPITFLGERLAEEKPVVRSWMVGSPATIPWETLPRKDGTYRLAGGLKSESFYPIVQGYKDSAAVGMRWNLSDPLQLNRLSVSASYSPDTGLPSAERVHLRAHYLRYDWRAEALFNNADFYDLFGPTKSGRKGYGVSVGRKWTIIYDEPRRLEFDVDGAYSGNLDRLPDSQNVAVDVSDLVTLNAKLGFSDVRNSQGYVDDETGIKWATVAQSYIVDGKFIPRARGDFAYGHALPIGHSSVWFRQSAGFSPRDRDQPFANFYFGGFGNNYVDRGEEKRYREYYSLAGADINEIGGRNFVKSSLEWNLPPWRFARLGTPGLYATWLRPAIFVTGLATNLDDSNVRRTVGNIGAQADIRISALSSLDLTLSFGGAVAFEDGHKARREFMVSLKVLR